MIMYEIKTKMERSMNVKNVSQSLSIKETWLLILRSSCSNRGKKFRPEGIFDAAFEESQVMRIGQSCRTADILIHVGNYLNICTSMLPHKYYQMKD